MLVVISMHAKSFTKSFISLFALVYIQIFQRAFSFFHILLYPLFKFKNVLKMQRLCFLFVILKYITIACETYMILKIQEQQEQIKLGKHTREKKLVRQSQIVQNAMYSHMYDAVIITQFVNYSCHSLLVSEGF